MRKEIRIGILGFGTVGTGAIRVLMTHASLIRRRVGVPLTIARVADLDIVRDRGITLPEGVLTTRPSHVIADPTIDIVVELIGGIEEARRYLLEAISAGKHVVTANKALLALHGEEIYSAADRRGVEVGFEGSVGGGIPIISILKNGFAGERIRAVYGIINGTSNFILTKMAEEGGEFSHVLAEAQKMGYAEADPTFDVDGIDSAHKLAILINLSFGTPVSIKEIYTEGMTRISPLDLRYAREFGYTVKLLGIAKESEDGVEGRVHPTMIPRDSLLAMVRGVNNAICVVGEATGETIFYGKGAGGLPTGVAVAGDIIDIARNIVNGGGRRVSSVSFLPNQRNPLRIKGMEEIRGSYYLRFMARDKPGVLSQISGVLGAHHISIASMIQTGRSHGGYVPVVMMTHEACERDVQAALSVIDEMPCVSEKTVLIRVEEGRDA